MPSLSNFDENKKSLIKQLEASSLETKQRSGKSELTRSGSLKKLPKRNSFKRLGSVNRLNAKVVPAGECARSFEEPESDDEKLDYLSVADPCSDDNVTAHKLQVETSVDRDVRKNIRRKLIEQEIEAVRKRVDEIYKNKANSAEDNDNERKPFFELVFAVVLVYTSFWTTFQVAFIGYWGSWFGFIVDRGIDVFFIYVFLKECRRPYHDYNSGLWVGFGKKTLMRYAKGRMVIDFLSSFGVLFCDSIGFYLTHNGDDRSTAILYRNPAILAATRLLRLSHLTKFLPYVHKVVNMYKLVDPNKWNYNSKTLVRFTLVIVTLVHWMACSWRLVVEFEKPFDSFYQSWIVVEHMELSSVGDLYVVCIYWATTTITTIGYGDVANPGTPFERGIGVFTMLVGALVWAYIIGGIVSVVSAFNIEEIEFSEQMDRLNEFMETKNMPFKLRHRLRRYFHHHREMERDNSYSSLLEKMSPNLRGEVAREVSEEWLKRVPWLNNGSLGFIASIAIALAPELYAPQEIITGVQLRVLTRGVVARSSRVYTRGAVWGIDMIVESPFLKNTNPARALTFAHLLCLQEESLQELLLVYPREKSRIRASAIWMSLRRCFVKCAQQMRLAKHITYTLAKETKVHGINVSRLFRKHDTRGKNVLNSQQFQNVLKELGFNGPTPLLNIIRSRFDKNADGNVTYKEFINYFFTGYSKDNLGKGIDISAFVNLKRLELVKQQQAANPDASRDSSSITLQGDPLGTPSRDRATTEMLVKEMEMEQVVVQPRKHTLHARPPEENSKPKASGGGVPSGKGGRLFKGQESLRDAQAMFDPDVFNVDKLTKALSEKMDRLLDKKLNALLGKLTQTPAPADTKFVKSLAGDEIGKPTDEGNASDTDSLGGFGVEDNGLLSVN